jgi:hypothetical protein
MDLYTHSTTLLSRSLSFYFALFLAKVATAGIAEQNPHLTKAGLGYSFKTD